MPPHDEQIVSIFPAGLGHNAGTEAVVDQPAGQQHVTERRVVNVGITVDQQHIKLIPAKGAHFFRAHGHKTRLTQAALRLCAASTCLWRVRPQRFWGNGLALLRALAQQIGKGRLARGRGLVVCARGGSGALSARRTLGRVSRKRNGSRF